MVCLPVRLHNNIKFNWSVLAWVVFGFCFVDGFLVCVRRVDDETKPSFDGFGESGSLKWRARDVFFSSPCETAIKHADADELHSSGAKHHTQSAHNCEEEAPSVILKVAQ